MGNNIDVYTPEITTFPINIKMIASGKFHTMIYFSNGTIKVAGDHSNGNFIPLNEFYKKNLSKTGQLGLGKKREKTKKNIINSLLSWKTSQ